MAELVIPVATEYRPQGIEQAKASVSTFASDIKEKLATATATANSALGDMDTKVEKVSESTRKSKEIFGTFAGQATTQAAGMVGALGPVGQVLGQIVNNASQAKLQFADIAKMAGSLGAVSLGFYAISSILKSNAEASKLAAETQKTYTKALIEGKTASEALVANQKPVEGFQATVRGGFTGHKTADVTESINKLGLSVRKLNELVLGGKDAWEAWRKSLPPELQATKGTKPYFGLLTETYSTDTGRVIAYIEQQANALEKGANKAAATIAVYGNEAEMVAGKIERLFPWFKNLPTAMPREEVKSFADVWGLASKNIEATRTQLSLISSEFGAGIGSALALEGAQTSANKAVEAYAVALDKARKAADPKTQEALKGALLQTKGAALQSAEAAYKWKYENSNATDESVRQYEALQEQIKELERLAAVAGPGSELRNALLGYADILRNKIPKSISTTIGINFEGGAGVSADAALGDAIFGPGATTIPAPPAGTRKSPVMAGLNRVPVSTVAPLTVNIYGATDPVESARQVRYIINTDAGRRSNGSTLT